MRIDCLSEEYGHDCLRELDRRMVEDDAMSTYFIGGKI